MLKILLLDDNWDNLFHDGRALKQLGCQVTETNDPTRALQLLRFTSPQFDVVFVDFYMPKINGLMFLQQVKTFYPALSVVLTSAIDNPDLEMQALTQGASVCMFENHSPEDFRLILEKLFPQTLFD